MNTRKIFALNSKVEKEAQKAVDKIYKKYSKELNKLIANQIPVGYKIIMGNGICTIYDSENNKIDSGKGWGRFPGNNLDLDRLSSLQYSDEIMGSFELETELAGTK